MKPAFLCDEAFLSDVRAAPARTGLLHLWWLGQSGFLVQHDGRFLLMDPYLSDSLTRKYAGTDTPHVRMSARVVDPARLGFVSVVTCSHAHTDHMDDETIRPILAANPAVELVIPEAVRDAAAQRLGVERSRPLGMDDDVQREAAGFTIRGIPSAHDVRETDGAGHHLYLGYVLEVGGRRIYHSGDTRHYEGLAERLAGFDLDVGLLPINGWSPERRVKGNLDIDESVTLGLAAGMRLVVPHHFDMFEFNTGDPAAFLAAAARGGLAVKVLRPGERLTLGGDGPGGSGPSGSRVTP
jgi:L-ascorbate metabolism protein UlaG (beta-lactamase superfamily)